MADPLSLLREFNIKKKSVEVDGTHFVFGDLTCPKNTETNFKVSTCLLLKSMLREFENKNNSFSNKAKKI
eukprot:Pgem_evm1s10107